LLDGGHKGGVEGIGVRGSQQVRLRTTIRNCHSCVQAPSKHWTPA